MTGQDYQCSIKAPISGTEAFDKISRVSEWWSKDFKGSARKSGDTFTVRFKEMFVDFKITEVVPDKKVVWLVIDSNLYWLSDKTEWNGTSIVWELSSDNGTTTVTMTHRGLVRGIECYGSCEEGWDFYVAKSLLQFLTENKGLPEEEMQKVKKATFEYTTYIETTPEQVWRALTDSELTRQYFLHEHVSDWKVGSRWEHIRADGSGVVMIFGTVLESTPPNRLVLTWERSIDPDDRSRVTFDIDPQGSVVCLTVIHEGLDGEYYAGMAAGWPKVLSNLKTLLETGHTLEIDWSDLKKVGRWQN